MNRIHLIGNLTRDPEFSETAAGVAVCKFSIAVGRAYADQNGEKQTDFFNCTAWRQTADAVARYTKKGNKIAVIGSMQSRAYEDRQGVKKTVWEVQVSEIEFLSPHEAQEKESEPPRGNTRGQAKNARKPVLQALDDDDDIPF
jgi:single-strand DNA-binding protein